VFAISIHSGTNMIAYSFRIKMVVCPLRNHTICSCEYFMRRTTRKALRKFTLSFVAIFNNFFLSSCNFQYDIRKMHMKLRGSTTKICAYESCSLSLISIWFLRYENIFYQGFIYRWLVRIYMRELMRKLSSRTRSTL
jgi:hypothetical protein